MSDKELDHIIVGISWCQERGDPLSLPQKETDGAAGFDISAAETVTIEPGKRILVPTGWKVQIPYGYELQVRARSGLSFKKSLLLTNGVGTIDADFRGEIHIPLANQGTEAVTIERGERVAQLVLQKLPSWRWKLMRNDELTRTARNEGGFGSTGLKKNALVPS